jgi:hypothetical protein
MKSWVVAIALAVLGCQTGTSTTTTEQAVTDDCYGTGNFCGASRPPITPWVAGDPYPQGTQGTVVVLMRRSSSVWHVFGADPTIGQIVWGRSMKPAAVGPFMALVGNANQAYGGVRPPVNPVCPPECGDPLPGYVMAAALRIAPISAEAQGDVDACNLGK